VVKTSTHTRRRAPDDIDEIVVASFNEYRTAISQFDRRWVFRGQISDWPLSSSLERALLNWDIPLFQAPEIERLLIRDFKRRAQPDVPELVHTDLLYCLAFMQHHGAPTRLIDASYSPYVAAKFAMESGGRGAVVWCVNGAWAHDATARAVGMPLVRERNIDDQRNDTSFHKMYVESPKQFVFIENPFSLNTRLVVQRGNFLCVGDIASTAMENFAAMGGSDYGACFVKLRLDLNGTERRNFALELRNMNMNSSVLFPGIDGFSRSLRDDILLYEQLAEDLTGRVDYRDPTRGLAKRP